MTGWVERPGTPMPISRITVGQFQDLGYTVNYAKADAYQRPTASDPLTRAAVMGSCRLSSPAAGQRPASAQAAACDDAGQAGLLTHGADSDLRQPGSAHTVVCGHHAGGRLRPGRFGKNRPQIDRVRLVACDPEVLNSRLRHISRPIVDPSLPGYPVRSSSFPEGGCMPSHGALIQAPLSRRRYHYCLACKSVSSDCFEELSPCRVHLGLLPVRRPPSGLQPHDEAGQAFAPRGAARRERASSDAAARSRGWRWPSTSPKTTMPPFPTSC